jgi:hypothetical protein
MRGLCRADPASVSNVIMVCHDGVGMANRSRIVSDQNREKFATQVDSSVLAAIRDLARSEGRPIHALVDEALADMIEKRKLGRPRARRRSTISAFRFLTVRVAIGYPQSLLAAALMT